MAGHRGKRAEVREIDAEALSANDYARITTRRERVTRALRLARQQLAEASAKLVEREPKRARWYCMQIEGRCEFAVEKLLLDAGVEVLFPREEVVAVRKGKKIVSQRAVLPGYLLTRIVPSPEAFAGLRMQRGVADIVGGPTGYHVVRDRDVAIFRAMSPTNIVGMATDKSMVEGSRAEIIIGPFVGFECLIIAIKWTREARARVLINVDGKAFEIDSMPLAFLKKL